jgi:hypothetical protein
MPLVIRSRLTCPQALPGLWRSKRSRPERSRGPSRQGLRAVQNQAHKIGGWPSGAWVRLAAASPWPGIDRHRQRPTREARGSRLHHGATSRHRRRRSRGRCGPRT